MTKFERRVAIIGTGLAAITAALFYVQLNEMSKQTQILASQSEGANAGALMDEMNTRRQLDISKEQAKASGQQAKAAIRTVQAMQDEMELSERPWIPVSDAIVGSPITIDITGKTRTSVHLHIANLGKTPAVSVYLKGPLQLTNRVPYPILKELCNSDSRGNNTFGPSGMNLFPGEAAPEQNWFYGAEGQAMRFRSTKIVPSGVTVDIKQPYYSLPLHLVGCVIYRASFAPGKRYYTGFIYNLWTAVGAVQFGGVPNSPATTVVQDGVTNYEISPSDAKLYLETAGGAILK